MQISNFRRLEKEGYTIERALVDVTTGCLWWKKTRTREIRKGWLDMWWFLDTGKYCPRSVEITIMSEREVVPCVSQMQQSEVK